MLNLRRDVALLALGSLTVLTLGCSGGGGGSSAAPPAPAPPVVAISSVSPTTGTDAGGTAITITGTGFQTGATVTVQGGAATSITVTPPSQITATTPAGTAGNADIVVTNPDATSATLVNGFLYFSGANPPAPTVASLVPTFGPTAGGTTVTVTGTGFQVGATVTVGGSAATGVTVVSASTLVFTTPAGSAGSASVVITNPLPASGNTATVTNGFTYGTPAPTVTAITPTSGPVAGGTLVTITGTGFQNSGTAQASVAISSVAPAACTGVQVLTAATMVATTSASTVVGPQDVVVTNPDTQSGTLTNGFTVNGPTPTISGIAPNVGSQTGTTTITITGTGFYPGATVTIGGTAATVVSVTGTQIVVTTSGGSNGPQNLVVTNLDGQTVTASGGFVYQGPAPTITSLSPNSGPQAGGTTVTITGTNFRTGATATFGSTAATVVSVAATQIVVTTPSSGAAGAVNVTVDNIDLTTVTATNAYTYNSGPAITAITPNNGAPAGGNSVTITGVNFTLPITSVTFGANGATITSSSTTQIVVTVPAGSVGTVTVTVTVSGGATATTSYTYNPAPTVTGINPTNGPATIATAFTITGTNFLTGATVDFGGTAATGVTVASSTSITGMAPTGSGTVTVTVTNPDGQTATTSFTYNPAPTITSINPTSGPATLATAFTITGANFVTGAGVTFGGNAATGVTVVGSTSITGTAPTGTGTVNVTVTNPDLQSATLVSGYTYNPPPTLTSIAPTSGPATIPSAFTLTGTNFVTGATVDFGGAAATGVTVVSATSTTGTTPTGTGTVSVTLTNPDGQSATLSSAYTYNPPPNPTAIAPVFGPAVGGTAFTITGTNFVTGATVDLGGTAATNVTVVSATSITGTSPAGTGTVSVNVTNPDNQVGTLASAFSYNPAPTVTSINPTNGPATIPTAFTITGTNFVTGAGVTFGGSAATSVTVVNSTTITGTTPTGTGTVTVTVTNPDTQVGSLVSGYTYNPAPTITSINPTSGPATLTTAFTLTGSNFVTGATVDFGGTAATGVTVVSPTSITGTAPTGTGTVNVNVTNPDAQVGTLTSGYTYNPPPNPTSINPTNGPATLTTAFTLTGTNFATGATVDFGGTAATGVTVVSSTSITGTAPTGTGTVNVNVTNPDAQVGTLTSGYTFNAAPTVTSITPSGGPTAGGTAFTITGAGFVTGATVTLGGSAATTVTVVSSTSITGTSPAGTGTVNVTVTNADTQSGTLTGGWTYAPPPNPTSINPTSGPAAGGTAFTLTGTNFVSGATIDFGGTAATGVAFVSSTTLTGNTPAGAAGAVNVTVTNPDAQTGTLTNGYTYTNNPPTLTGVSPAAGPEIGGTTITLTGSNYVSPATVTVNGVNCTNVVVVSTTSITAVTPAGTPGTGYAVAVTTAGGTATWSSTWSYLPTQTMEFTGQTDWLLQSGSSVDRATSPGDVQLQRKVGAFFGEGVVVNAIAYYHSGATPQRILVGTNNCGAFLTTDGGSTWTPFNVYTSPALPSNRVLSAGFFSGGNSGNTFIIGTDTGAVLTSDGGTTFRLYNTTSTPALPANRVESVSFYDGNTTGTHFLIACNDNNAFGGNGGALHTTDGGGSFTTYDSANLTNALNFVRGVAYSSGSTNAFLIASDGIDGFGTGGVYYTTNGGTSFARFHIGSTQVLPSNNVVGVAFLPGSTTTWLAACAVTFGGGGAVRTTDGGATAGNWYLWDSTTNPALPSDNALTVSFSTVATHFAIGTDTGLVYTTDGAKPSNPGRGTFSTLNTGSTPAIASNQVNRVHWFQGSTTAIFGVACGARTTTTAVGAAHTLSGIGSSPAVAALTLPAPNLLPHDDVRAVAVYRGDGTGNRLLVATPLGVMRSADGGATWTRWHAASSPALPSNNVSSVAWYEGDTVGGRCVIGTAAGVVVVNNASSGTPTFTTLTTAQGLVGNVVQSVAYYSGSTTIVDTILAGTSAGLSYVVNATGGTPTFTNRTTATARALPSNNVQGVGFFDGLTVSTTWLAATAGGLVRTTDGGVAAGNWVVYTTASTPALPSNNVSSCAWFNNATTGDTFVAGTAAGAVLTTNATSGGSATFTTFTTASGLPNNTVVGAAFFSGNTTATHFAFACGGGTGGLALTTNQGSSFTALDTTTSPRLPSNTVSAVDYDDSVSTADRYLVGCDASAAAASLGGAVYEQGTTYQASGTLTVPSIEGGVIPRTPPLSPTWDDRYGRGVDYYDGNTTGTTFILGGRYGAATSSNAGTTFLTVSESTTQSNVAIANSDVRGVAMFRGSTTAGTWLIATAQGAFLTTNGGTSYTAFTTTSSPAIPSDDVRAVAFNDGTTNGAIFAIATGNGLAYTTNGGSSFTIRNSASTPAITNGCLSVDYWDGSTTGQRFAVGTTGGVYHTENGGTAFTNRVQGFAATSLPGNTVNALAYSTVDATGVDWVAGVATGGFAVGGIGVTVDNGANFTRFNAGTTPALPANYVSAVDWFAGSTTVTDTILVGTTGGVSYGTGLTGGTPAITTHTTAGGLPSNDVRGVAFFHGITTAGTWVLGTDGGFVRTVNGTTATPTFTAFRRGTLSQFLRLEVSETKPANTSITYQILDSSGNLIPDAVLTGNSTGLTPTSGQIDLTAIPVATYPTIQVRAILSTTAPASTPVLHWIRVVSVY